MDALYLGQSELVGNMNKRDIARKIVRRYMQEGRKFSGQTLAVRHPEADCSNSTFEEALSLERAYAEGRADLLQEIGAGHAHSELKLRDQSKLEVFKAQLIEDLGRQFAEQKAEMQRDFDRRLAKKLLELAEAEEKAEASLQRYGEWTAAQKVRMSPEEYTTVLRCLHPDNSASDETRTNAFRVFSALKFVLTGKK